MLSKLWTTVKDWAWWFLWGWVWTAMLSYLIRIVWRPEVFERLPPAQNLMFIMVLWVLVTVFFVRPHCLRNADSGAEAD